MTYDKPAKSYEDQAELLLKRGLVADKQQLVQLLSQVNYYRLSTYLYTFRNADDNFAPGTTLERVLRIYEFDHELRILLLDIIEGVEVLVRSRLAYYFSLKHGPFQWTNLVHFPNFNPAYDDFARWQTKLTEQTRRSRDLKSNEDTVTHFFHKYGKEHSELPIWILAEIMDFGATLSFFRGVETDVRKNVSLALNQPEEVVLSWLLSLNTIRNRCAHHSRLWNWQMGIPVKLPNARKYPEWNLPSLSNRHLGAILYMCAWASRKLVLKEQWAERTSALLKKYEDLDLRHVGMPVGWKEDKIWKSEAVQ